MSDAGMQRVIDRAEITDLLATWAHAIDFLEWGALRDDVFAENVTWEWRASDGLGSLTDETHGNAETVAWFSRAIKPGTPVRHILTNHSYRIGDDAAHATCYMQLVDSSSLKTVASGLLTAAFVRSDGGWRIDLLRVEENIPAGSIEQVATGSSS
jgi:hypothetical protein